MKEVTTKNASSYITLVFFFKFFLKVLFIIYFCLICISLSDVEHILCAFWPSVCLLQRNAYLGLLPIFWLSCLFLLLLSCMSNFYFLDTKPLLVALFANIFSHYIGYIFVLFMVSFAVLEIFVWLGPICLFLFLFLLPGKLT